MTYSSATAAIAATASAATAAAEPSRSTEAAMAGAATAELVDRWQVTVGQIGAFAAAVEPPDDQTRSKCGT